MEVMGGLPFIDGEWESICKILSFDQDLDNANSVSHNVLHGPGETLIELLMGNSNPSTSECAFSYTNHQVLQTPFRYNASLVNANQDDDQISSLTSTSSKKRAHPIDNRKMQPKKSKIEAFDREEKERLSSDECNSSQEVTNEKSKEIPINGTKRANRGGATDPQSLYARKRRERINERLRTLQNLVPNGTKVDISTMLEEAVTYVKFLQMQIKLLSSDDTWMYAPLAYNGFDVGHYNV